MALRPVRHKLFAWVSVGLIFIAGGITSLIALRLSLPLVIRYYMDTDPYLLEHMLTEGFLSDYHIDSSHSDEVFEILRSHIAIGRAASMRNRVEMDPIIKSAMDKLKVLVPPEYNKKFEARVRRLHRASPSLVMGSLYDALDLDYEQGFAVELAIASHYEEVRGTGPLTEDRAKQMSLQMLGRARDQIRAMLRPDQQPKLDALGLHYCGRVEIVSFRRSGVRDILFVLSGFVSIIHGLHSTSKGISL